jgi:hypothetical protein
MGKPKRQIEIEAAIYRGHQAGICDMEGNSVDSFDKTPTARPYRGRPTFRIRYVNGVKQVDRGNGWKAEGHL